MRVLSLLFLPGASGNTHFWRPVGARLRHPGARRFLAWPGFGGVPSEPGVTGIADLVARVVREITGPVDLLGQSMGGVIAVRAALEKPDLVRHLVLSVTSGGIDVASLGARDWRPTFRARNPELPGWFVDEREDLTERLRETRFPSSCCGETQIQSVQSLLGDGSPSYFRAPSWSLSSDDPDTVRVLCHSR
jgi:pimeloyl-ACP methyl ester carboxylesterase